MNKGHAMDEDTVRKLMEEFRTVLDMAFERGAKKIHQAMIPEAGDDNRNQQMVEDIREIRETLEEIARLQQEAADGQ